MKLIIGMTGATGAPLGVALLQALRDMPEVETHLVMSKWAKTTIELETPWTAREVAALADFSHSPADQAATISSGSFRTDGMIVIPCSMKTLAGIRAGACKFSFAADKRFTATFGSRTFTGTYEFTGESHDIALHFEMSSKYDLGTLNGKTYLSGTDLQILFPATRLLKMVDVLGQKLASFSTTAATVSTLVGKFDDLYLGFEFTKQ